MDKKVVFNVEMEEYASLTPEEIFTKMLEGTGEDGVLTVKEMADAPSVSEPGTVSFRMNWENADAGTLSEKFEKFTGSLLRIASKGGSRWSSSEEDGKELPDEDRNVWETYIRDFSVFPQTDLNEICEIEEKIAVGEPLNTWEKVAIAMYKGDCLKDAEKRIGTAPLAYETIIRARRYERLLELDAPQIILDNERNMLAESLAIHRFAEEEC